MLIETATSLEAIRTAIAVCGAVAAVMVGVYTTSDFLALRREGVNGPTGIVYAEKLVIAAILLAAQIVYTGVGVSAMMAPSPTPPSVAAALSEEARNAVMSIPTYLTIAVQSSIFVTSAMLGGSLWQLWSRHRLVSALRSKANIAQAAAQAQRDRIEQTGLDTLELGRDTNTRLRRGDIGRGETALVQKEQGDVIQATTEEAVDRLRREGIGDETP